MDKKQKKKIYNKEYRIKNKQHLQQYEKTRGEYFKAYRLTEPYKKTQRIRNWKRYGVIGDYNLLYEKYLNTSNCENCNKILTYDKRHTHSTKCLDHDHDTGLFRNILCHSCNTTRG